jgi:osmotically inducible lipoprotein OsmB
MLLRGCEAFPQNVDAARLFEFSATEDLMKKAVLVMTLIIAIFLSGCSGMSVTQQRTLSGGAIGASAGAIAGAVAGNTGMGLAIGAAAGAAGGYLYDQHEKSKETAYKNGYNAGQKAK